MPHRYIPTNTKYLIGLYKISKQNKEQEVIHRYIPMNKKYLIGIYL